MRIILYLFLLAALFIYGWGQIYDGDIGHHLRAGEWMLAHGRILDRDIFSYTAPGHFWLNHSWLAEIILYGVWWVGGINGLIFFKIFILILSYGFIIKAGHLLLPGKKPADELIIAVLFIMAVVSGSIRFMVRPLIFTFLAVALATYLFVRSRREVNCLFYLPLVLAFWVNLHAEFMLGLIMVILFWLHQVVLFVLRPAACHAAPSWRVDEVMAIPKRSQYRVRFFKATMILILSLASLLITPYGWKLFLHPLKLTSSDFFMTRISEWLPVFHPLFREENSIKMFYGFLGLGLLSFLLNFKKKDTLFFLFFLTLALMSLSAVRFMPYFAMAGIPAVSENLSQIKMKLGKRIKSPCLRLAACRLGFTAVIIWSLVLVKGRTHYSEFGLGLAEKVCYPRQAGEFLDKAGISGNMFNMCDFGGFFIWFHPGRPVFVDGRLDVYGEDIYHDFLCPSEEVFKKYKVDYIFLSYRHPVTHGLLYANKDWPLVYWDDTVVIQVRRTKRNESIIEKYAYNYIHPLSGSYNFLPEADPRIKAAVFKEIHRALRLSPQSIRAHVVLGDIYVELKEYEKAVLAYEEAIKLGERYETPYMVKIYHNLANLYHNLKRYPEAETYYRQVIKLSRPGETLYSQALEDWGQLAYVRGEKETSLRLIKAALKGKKRYRNSLLSTYPITLAKLALLYEDLGRKDKAVTAWQEVYQIGGQETRQQAEEHLEKIVNNAQ